MRADTGADLRLHSAVSRPDLGLASYKMNQQTSLLARLACLALELSCFYISKGLLNKNKEQYMTEAEWAPKRKPNIFTI